MRTGAMSMERTRQKSPRISEAFGRSWTCSESRLPRAASGADFLVWKVDRPASGPRVAARKPAQLVAKGFFAAADDALGETIKFLGVLKAAADVESELAIGP